MTHDNLLQKTITADFDPSFVGVWIALVAFLGIAYLFGRCLMLRKSRRVEIRPSDSLSRRLKHTRRLARLRYGLSYHRGSTMARKEVRYFRMKSISLQRLVALVLCGASAFLLSTQYLTVRSALSMSPAPDFITIVIFFGVLLVEYHGAMACGTKGVVDAAMTYGAQCYKHGIAPRYYESRALSQCVRDWRHLSISAR
ncbi:hypothetical protein IKF15_01690 [Candidatus Saccharibacteria bacterium]|nr:hypothetical protein [Candidatus Saccharibacteria bacterium]